MQKGTQPNQACSEGYTSLFLYATGVPFDSQYCKRISLRESDHTKGEEEKEMRINLALEIRIGGPKLSRKCVHDPVHILHSWPPTG